MSPNFLRNLRFHYLKCLEERDIAKCLEDRMLLKLHLSAGAVIALTPRSMDIHSLLDKVN